MNAWQKLGLPVCLSLEAENIEQCFRQASEGAHPDAGGEAGRFEELREARDVLRDDFRRLEAWLHFKEVELSHSGVVSPEAGEMFVKVNELTTGVDHWLAQGAAKSSGLGKALWQKEGFTWKARLEVLQEEVAEWYERTVADFAAVESNLDFEKALLIRGELGFLRKWKASLQERFGKIWEGLV